jgi:hypothetical protein
MNLSLELIRTYNFPERIFKPDWDDTYIEFELPNGVTLEGAVQISLEPTKTDTLYGFDEFLTIETKEELDELLNMSYREVVDKIANENEDFNREEWIDED